MQLIWYDEHQEISHTSNHLITDQIHNINWGGEKPNSVEFTKRDLNTLILHPNPKLLLQPILANIRR